MFGRIYYIPLKLAEVKTLKNNLYNLQRFILSILPSEIAEDLHQNIPGKRTHKRGNVSFFPLGKIFVVRFGFFGSEWEHHLIVKTLAKLQRKIGITTVNFEKNENRFFTVSPIFIRNSHGKCLYPPRYQKEFEKLLEEHIIRKAKAWGYQINQVKVTTANTFSITRGKYKDFSLPAWRGTLTVQASPEILSLIYTTGLGGRTMQGFGSLMLLSLQENFPEVVNG